MKMYNYNISRHRINFSYNKDANKKIILEYMLKEIFFRKYNFEKIIKNKFSFQMN